MLLTFGAVGPARADSLAAAQERQITTTYEIYSHGVHVLDAQADYSLTPWGYGVSTRLHTGGVMNWFLKMDVHSSAQGHFVSGGVEPGRYESVGYSRGRRRQIVLAYAGGTPKIVTLYPKEEDRESVAPQLLPHTADTLSAMMLLVSTLRKTGRCDGSLNVFDGLRLTTLSSRGPFKDKIPALRVPIAGTGIAWRCDFVGRQTGGFIKDSKHLAAMMAPHAGAAWFVDFPRIGLVPVKIMFEHPKLGRLDAVMNHLPINTTRTTL